MSPANPTASTVAPTNTATEQRDARGRFAPGNPGGPGNPFGRRVADLRKAMLAAVTLPDIADVFQALLAKAKTGDTQAIKLFLAYTVGKPDTVPDPDRVDVEDWEVQKETAAMTDTLAKVMRAPTANVALNLARAARPGMSMMYAKTFTDMIQKAVQEADAAKNDAPPSANGFSPVPAAALPKGSFTEVPPEMEEFYQKLVERGFAPPLPSGDGRR